MAEVVRAGLQAIPKGQFEGAMAPGLNYAQRMRLIVLPALEDVVPVEILASPDLKGLGDTVESTRWKWIEMTCIAARACQSLVCCTHPASLVCFACAAVSTACTILDVVCGWLGC